MSFSILLYYAYVPITDPAAVMQEQRELCSRLGLKGRIIVAHEGINGTLEGTLAATEEYCQTMLQQPLFQNIHFKKSSGTGISFPKLSVKVRSEIVSAHLGPKDLNPRETTGKYITAEELHEWFETGKEFYIVDMRNGYEQKAGFFENSLLSRFENFRDLPQIIERLEAFKNKTIVTVCTGGVRCEKASGFLVQNGFTDVYQLYDGIVTYMEKYPNQHFKGKLYVFDGRLVMGFHTDAPEHEVVGRCDRCGSVSENFVNCANNACHDHFICCENCLVDGQPYCTTVCEQICLSR